MIELFKPRAPTSLLGLAFDGDRLEAVELRRANGELEVRKSFSAALSLDLLTSAPELAGREIRNQLAAAGVRERRCAVCLPLSWVLTLTVELPDLAEPDRAGFLQIEAERGFPYSPEALMLAPSLFQAADGRQYATLVAVLREHVARLETVLRAAQLKPVSFSLGLAALPGAGTLAAEGVLALVPSATGIGLQLTCGGGVAVMRLMDGVFEMVGSEQQLQPDQLVRELRITLGQLPPDVRAAVRRVRVLGHSELARELAEQLPSRLEALGLEVELTSSHGPDDFGLRLPAGVATSMPLSLAARQLAGQKPAFEFLPPRVSPWRQLAARYSSGKLVWAGAGAGAVAAIVGLAFLGQQIVLWRWQYKWNSMKSRVAEIEAMQQQIRHYRPWFDDSFRSLSILRRLTEAFPEDGMVSAKTVEIRQPTVTCKGTARDNQSWLRVLDQLRAAKGIEDVQVETIRGRAPLEFTVKFRWAEGGSQ